MNTSRTPASSITIRKTLIDSLRKAKERACVLDSPVLASVAQPTPQRWTPLDIFAAIGRHDSYRTFWARPAQKFWLVGVGSAFTIAVRNKRPLHKMRRAHRSLLDNAVIKGPVERGVGPVFIGGSRFDTQATRNPLWDDFQDGLLVLPRFLITESGGDRWLTINTLVQPEADPEMEAAKAAADLEALAPNPSTITEQPQHPHEIQSTTDSWLRWVQQALQVIAKGQLTKVVLARTTTLHAEREFSVEAALAQLTHAYPKCSIFAVGNSKSIFVGASPEVLACLNKGTLTVSCLAGTIRRGATPKEDKHLVRELLGSAKEQREHAAVVAAVAQTMGKICNDLQWDDTLQVVTLPTVHHLATSFTGRPKGPSNVLRLVEMLHPTPAVGGVPTEEAMETIRRLEGDRGWYAAPIGWVDHNGEGEFTVGIRSALVSGNQATLFAGSGIVKGSNLDSELEETALKFQPLRAALCGR